MQPKAPPRMLTKHRRGQVLSGVLVHRLEAPDTQEKETSHPAPLRPVRTAMFLGASVFHQLSACLGGRSGVDIGQQRPEARRLAPVGTQDRATRQPLLRENSQETGVRGANVLRSREPRGAAGLGDSGFDGRRTWTGKVWHGNQGPVTVRAMPGQLQGPAVACGSRKGRSRAPPDPLPRPTMRSRSPSCHI